MQFVVPQFIEVESKIIGPISARQFIILMVMMAVDFILYKFFPVIIFMPTIIVFTLFCFTLAFVRINGQAMHYVMLNFIQTFRNPRVRIWARTQYIEREEEDDDEPTRAVYIPKQQASSSRLAAMSLMVDTGGTYATDEVRKPDAAASINPPKPKAPESSNVNLK